MMKRRQRRQRRKKRRPKQQALSEPGQTGGHTKRQTDGHSWTDHSSFLAQVKKCSEHANNAQFLNCKIIKLNSRYRSPYLFIGSMVYSNEILT